MPQFEQLVRPFQSPLFRLPWPIPAAAGVRTTIVSGNGRVVWGEAGQMPTPSAGNVNFCVTQETEQKRITQQVTIFQNGDMTSPNFVVVERPLEIDFSDISNSFEPISAQNDYVAADLSAYDAQEQALFAPFEGTASSSQCSTSVKYNPPDNQAA